MLWLCFVCVLFGVVCASFALGSRFACLVGLGGLSLASLGLAWPGSVRPGDG